MSGPDTSTRPPIPTDDPAVARETLAVRDDQRTSPEPASDTRAERASRADVLRAYSVHVYTASGIVFAFLAAREMLQEPCDPRWVFGWLLAAVFVDATDGPLARRWHVKSLAPRLDGRTIDDILDYLTFAFLPLLLVYRMQWVPDVVSWVVAAGMLASLLGFSNVGAKEEDEGFFRGFPSYWNIYAFYAGLAIAAWHSQTAQWFNAALLVILAVLTVAPVRFIYPNLAPPRWRAWVLGGAAVWTLLMLAMLPSYPDCPAWLTIASLVYPAFYTVLSVGLDVQARRRRAPR